MSARSRRLAVIVAVASSLALAACGGRADPGDSRNTAVGETGSPAPSGSTPAGKSTFPSMSPAPGGTAPQPPPTGWPSPSPGKNYLDPTSSPQPFSAPWTPEVPVDATVSPACIRPGGTASLSVKTEPRAGVAWHAIYAGSRGGAQPPFGSGYGGNDKGFTDEQGRYSATWAVSAQAPPGPGRVDVVVGTAEDKWGYDDPPFWIADSSGNCQTS